MRQKKLLQFLVGIALLFILADPSMAQEDVYVDAPIDAQQPAAARAAPAGNFPDQFNWGLINYGFTNNVYYQYSGNTIFSGGNSPDSFLNIGWIRLIPLDFKYLPGMAYGADFMVLNSTSEEVYSGDKDTVVGPSIDMAAYLTNFKVRLFFMDPVNELLHPFFGISWGLIFGDFNATEVGGDKHSTNFSGVSISRNVGVQVKLGDRGGLVTEFRAVSAGNISTSNDPFNRGDGESVDLDFSGVTIALSGYYRF